MWPAINEIEFHPYASAATRELVAWCHSKGIVVIAYGSLGGSTNRAQGGDAVAAAAGAHNASAARVLLHRRLYGALVAATHAWRAVAARAALLDFELRRRGRARLRGALSTWRRRHADARTRGGLVRALRARTSHGALGRLTARWAAATAAAAARRSRVRLLLVRRGAVRSARGLPIAAWSPAAPFGCPPAPAPLPSCAPRP